MPSEYSYAGVDIVIVGAGIVGLATAWQLLQRHPWLRISVLEKEDDIATHQTGHNSGVLHAGIYYKPGTLKARLCMEGKCEMEAFAQARGIPFRRCGKLIVAVEERELAALASLAERARENGIDGIEEVGADRIAEIEPAVRALRGLYSRGTGVIDYRAVARVLAAEITAAGGDVLTGRRVTAIRMGSNEVVVETPAGETRARFLVTCAGLHSDRIAAMTGHRDGVRIMPVRGDYYTLKPEAHGLVRALVYPVPDPRYPFLGVHFTRGVDDHVHAGPNAVLAFAREGYRLKDVSARDISGMLAFPGFYRMAAAHGATGLGELHRGISRRAFATALRRYIPAIEDRVLVFGPSGVRAQALDARGRFLDDFSFGGTGRVLHVRNAPSPAATASLAIGRYLAEEARRRFDLA